MRIFCAVRHAADPGRFYGSLWSGNFYPALRQLGHEVVESQVDLGPTSAFMQVPDRFTPAQLAERGRTTDAIVAEVARAHAERPVDLFLSYFYNSHFDPAGFAAIGKLGIPTVNYYCNSIYQFELVAAVAAKADVSWHAEKHARQSYLDVGANPVWVQMAADPDVYRPVAGVARAAKATFVGMRYADRDRWMAELVRAGVPVDIYGPGWGEAPPPPGADAGGPPVPSPWARRVTRVKNYAGEVGRNVSRHGLVGGARRTRRQWDFRRETDRLRPLFPPHARGPIPFTRIADVFSSYEVVLNFANVWADGRPGSDLIPHVRLRDFEAPMCRTCYLTAYTDELAEFYDPGTEVETYRSAAELVDKTRFYLAHPDAAERLRAAGYARARRDHTWVRRFEQLFAAIGVGGGGGRPG